MGSLHTKGLWIQLSFLQNRLYKTFYISFTQTQTTGLVERKKGVDKKKSFLVGWERREAYKHVKRSDFFGFFLYTPFRFYYRGSFWLCWVSTCGWFHFRLREFPVRLIWQKASARNCVNNISCYLSPTQEPRLQPLVIRLHRAEVEMRTETPREITLNPQMNAELQKATLLSSVLGELSWGMCTWKRSNKKPARALSAAGTLTVPQMLSGLMRMTCTRLASLKEMS